MFKDEDENEDDGAAGQTRYPVMPSLVALQQMRNRLHLAYLGKKLMKWSAIATGKALRQLAEEINETYENYSEIISSAFMQLARARYFLPRMNDDVLENVSNKAAVLVEVTHKSVSGVKVLQLEFIDTGADPYRYLGIEKGGSAIIKAKKMWKDLLKLMILMLEEKTSFENMDVANKNATKRQNVLGKLVVPRISKTIAYILDELEEKEREEFFRLKKVLQVKQKHVKRRKSDQRKACEKSALSIPNIPNTNLPTSTPLSVVPSALSSTRSPLAEAVIVPTVEEEYGPNYNTNINTVLEQEEKEIDVKKLKENLSGVIHAKKETYSKELRQTDIDKFLSEARELNLKLDKLLKLKKNNELCKICNHNLREGSQNSLKLTPETHQSLKTSQLLPEPKPPDESKEHSKLSLKSNIVSSTTSETNNLEMGSYEYIDETIKVSRVRNEDGTIIEEKKIVKTKQIIRSQHHTASNNSSSNDEVTYQSSKESANSNFPNNCCCEIVNLKTSYLPRNAQSTTLSQSSYIIEPIIRTCISFADIYSLNHCLGDASPCFSSSSSLNNNVEIHSKEYLSFNKNTHLDSNVINKESCRQCIDSGSNEMTISEAQLILNVHKNPYERFSKISSVENITKVLKKKNKELRSAF